MSGIRALVVVAFTTAAFTLALLSRGPTNVWLVTTGAGLAGLVLALAADGARLTARLRPKWRTALAGLGAGVALVAVTHLAYALAVARLPSLGADVAVLYAVLEDPPGPLAALPLVALVALAEEVVWRGVALDQLAHRLGRVAGLVAATLLYAVPHLLTGETTLALAGVGCGLVWGGLYLATGELVAPFVCHLVWNALIFSVVPLAG